LSCNYSSKIIDPIQSRCTVFRFKRLDEEDAKSLLERISKEENIDINEEAYEAIIYVSQGDLRRAINLLQSASSLEKSVTKEVIYDVSAQAKPETVEEMLKNSVKGNFKQARKKLYELIVDQGIAGEDVVKEIHRQTKNLDIEESKKIELLEKIGEYEFRLGEGSNPQIQLEALLASFSISK
ncbi:MAG: hypothetical protein ABEK17_04255, partial [Candidatus Aenigmatarchaeota archaeon]